jgi:hypothetical protein
MKKFISLILILSSCVYPFDLSEDVPEKLLVVEGYISNKEKDSEIRLSYSNKFKTRMFEMISDAQVIVLENNSIAHTFVENEPGIYLPSDTLFVANSNSVYKMQLVIDNKTYESSEVRIKRSAEIERLDFRTTDKYIAGDDIQYRALEILVTNYEDPDVSKYHRYSVDETWLVTSRDTFNQRFRPIFIYDKAGIIVDVSWNVESNIQSTYCWASSSVKIFQPTSTEGLIRNQLVRVPVFGTSIQNIKLLYKYSVLVKQYSIPQETYYFLSMMNQFSENDVSLYDTQPGYVDGNIRCLNDGKEKVIGVFYASDVVEKRIFIRINDLNPTDRAIVKNSELVCPLEFVSVPNSENANKTPSLTYLRDSVMYGKGYVVANVLFEADYDITQNSYEYCCDCRVLGSNIKPDFWGDIFF